MLDIMILLKESKYFSKERKKVRGSAPRLVTVAEDEVFSMRDP